MVSRDYFSHTTPTGEAFDTRILATGYVRSDQLYELGENIDCATLTLATPAATVNAWMNSPEHRENILNGEYRETGVGVAAAAPRTSRAARPAPPTRRTSASSAEKVNGLIAPQSAGRLYLDESPVRHRVRKDIGAGARRAACILSAAAAAALMLAAPVAASAASASTPAGATPEGATATVATLSNLKTLTRWAYPQAAAPAHAFPSAHARVVGHLKFLTPDGQAQVYLALRSYTIGNSKWIEVPLPGRPNGRDGWVAASDLGETHEIHEYLRINREAER